jgi:DNA-directed RNA polymerase beta' subunit
MARGRKADKGTYEARGKIILICDTIRSCSDLSDDAKNRVIKALYFGLGIQKKDVDLPYAEEKVITQEETAVPIKEKKASKKITLDNTEGDEYFAPEDCKEVGY